MKVRNILAACLPVLLFSALISCEEPSIYSEAPEYGNLKFTTEAPSSLTLENQGSIKISSICDPNDSVTVFMQVAYPGKFITKVLVCIDILVLRILILSCEHRLKLLTSSEKSRSRK